MKALDSLPELRQLGFSTFFYEQYLALNLGEGGERTAPQRVSEERRSEYVLIGADGARRAVLSGRLRHTLDPVGWPCVGDWVLTDPEPGLARIEHIFTRSTLFSRKESGRAAAQQPIAANVDVAFIVGALAPEDADPHALRHGLSVRRIERYLRAVSATGVRGTVVVNKADLHENAAAMVAPLRAALGGADVLLVSAETGEGVTELASRIDNGETAVFVGSSGVGKSSLTNRLLGKDVQRTDAVREADTRGRHTTSHRALFVLPRGGVLIDTPGMREFAPWAEDDELPDTGFADVDQLAVDCRYRDCRHEDEPGCAVRAAVDAGTLSEERLESAKKLQRELARQRERQDGHARLEAKRRGRILARRVREAQDAKKRGG